jgi:hypothetical protein
VALADPVTGLAEVLRATRSAGARLEHVDDR